MPGAFVLVSDEELVQQGLHVLGLPYLP
jgi:hypothetical protein